MKKLKNSKGFTLMEMLIVVAIIAILVAIAIPTFTNQLEKAREATDMANLRGAYAEVMVSALAGEEDNDVVYDAAKGTWTKKVASTQKVDGWQTALADGATGPTIGGYDNVAAKKGGTEWTIVYNETDNTTTIS